MMTEKLIALWEGTLRGNERDYAQLHAKLYPKLFVFTTRMLDDNDLVNDLLQDLFIKFWENREKIGTIRNVEAYFYRSARSIVLNHIRLTKHREAKLTLMPVQGLVFSAEEIMVSNESDSLMKQQMVTALNSLPAKQREILTMRFYDELSYPQIADILKIRYQSVINHVYRAVQTLRQVSDLSSVYAA
ncbi:RNA polymerase sigma factor [Pedobacter ginsenosidimutans]|nr:sigma-70 family RNA polymerase sigma factor [Pedobacter ginsenosidimutans]